MKLQTSNLAGTFTRYGIAEQKPIKTFGEKEVWPHPGTAQIFWGYPYYLMNIEQIKLRTSNFVRIFISIGRKDR